jgi:hypothetical protein
MGPTRCPETSVNNYHTTPCNYPKDHRLHQHRGGSLKSRKARYLIVCEVTILKVGTFRRSTATQSSRGSALRGDGVFHTGVSPEVSLCENSRGPPLMSLQMNIFYFVDWLLVRGGVAHSDVTSFFLLVKQECKCVLKWSTRIYIYIYILPSTIMATSCTSVSSTNLFHSESITAHSYKLFSLCFFTYSQF